MSYACVKIFLHLSLPLWYALNTPPPPFVILFCLVMAYVNSINAPGHHYGSACVIRLYDLQHGDQTTWHEDGFLDRGCVAHIAVITLITRPTVPPYVNCMLYLPAEWGQEQVKNSNFLKQSTFDLWFHDELDSWLVPIAGTKEKGRTNGSYTFLGKWSFNHGWHVQGVLTARIKWERCVCVCVCVCVCCALL
jgi:hypothetical protein